MKKIIEEFKKFIRRGNVMDMAVGVTVGAAFSAVVNAFSKGFIAPLIALLTDSADLSGLKWVIRPAVVDETGATVREEVAILFGSFLSAVLDFFVIAVVLFFILKAVNFMNERAARLADEVKDNIEKSETVDVIRKKLRKLHPEREEQKQEETTPPPPVEDEITLLREIRDALKNKNSEE